VPTAPTLNWFSANVLEIVWLVPFRLYCGAADQLALRKLAMAFLPRYIVAISQDVKLLGIVPGGSVRVQSFGIFNAEQHGFDGLGGIFQVVERLDSGNQAYS
jgi:hypothetical protein